MAAHTVTVHLPPSLYSIFKSQARRSRRSIEAELLDAVEAAPVAAESAAAQVSDRRSEAERWEHYAATAAAVRELAAADWERRTACDTLPAGGNP